MRWWHLHMCVCGRTRTLLICKMKQWFQRDRKQCHNTLSWPPPLSPSERLPTCCVHTSVCLSVCIHKINELCVCIVRVRRPSVYIKNVTWPWQAEAGFLRRTGRGKKGRPLFTAASAVALNQWRPPATPSLPPPLMPPPPPLSYSLCLSVDPCPSLLRSVRHPAAPHHPRHHQSLIQPPFSQCTLRCQRPLCFKEVKNNKYQCKVSNLYGNLYLLNVLHAPNYTVNVHICKLYELFNS